MKILVLGGAGFLGPHVVKALEATYALRVTDIKAMPKSPHETRQVDIADFDQVRRAAEGTDAIVNCSVLRPHRKVAWNVNTLGTYNAVRTAAELGHQRFINTGPLFTLIGPAYREMDFGATEQAPPHAGTNLYALSKSTGQEICRTFAANYPLHVLTMIYSSFPDPEPAQSGQHLNPFAITFRDGAQAIKCALEADLNKLPSRCEIFFVTSDLPHRRYSNAKTKKLLGFTPRDTLEAYWRKPKTQT